jgi:predicted nucleotidyltransferase component of viral defense system
VNAVPAGRNIAASIRQRLLNRARANGEDFQLLLDRYAVERFLYRLSVSNVRDEFLLKGALLFTLWFNVGYRPTRDADFLGYGPRDGAALAKTVRGICAIECEDGIAFDADSIKVAEIREHASYQGLRVTLRADLDKARCTLQLDVGYGDAVTPAPVDITFPVLLEHLPAPKLRAYPRETVFAEKLEAIALLGIANSRMKDYFDLWALAREGAMDIDRLGEAIAATFARRGTSLPAPMPLGLTAAFSEDAQKRTQWNAFVARNRLDAPDLDTVVEALASFLQRPLTRARRIEPERKDA